MAHLKDLVGEFALRKVAGNEEPLFIYVNGIYNGSVVFTLFDQFTFTFSAYSAPLEDMYSDSNWMSLTEFFEKAEFIGKRHIVNNEKEDNSKFFVELFTYDSNSLFLELGNNTPANLCFTNKNPLQLIPHSDDLLKVLQLSYTQLNGKQIAKNYFELKNKNFVADIYTKKLYEIYNEAVKLESANSTNTSRNIN